MTYSKRSIASGLVLALSLGCEGVKADAQAEAAARTQAARVDAQVEAKAEVKAEVKAPEVGAVVVGGGVVVLKSVAEVEAALGKQIALKAADLDLAGLVALVVAGKLSGAAELELLLNAPGGASHHIDLDADGSLDYVQVVELRVGGVVKLELRAVPSSKADASLAVVVGSLTFTRADAEGQLRVAASYGAAVAGGAGFTFERSFAATFAGDAVVLVDAEAGIFLAWAVQAGRAVYASTHLTAADISVGVGGGVQWSGDTSVQLTSERLAALRGALKVELALPQVDTKVDTKVDAKAGAGIKHSAKASGGVKVGGGVKAGGSVGVSIGGGIGGSIGGGGKAGGKVGGGIKIGK